MSLEQQWHLLQQAQEQIKQQIINHSQAPLNKEHNGVLQGIPATQAVQTVSVHPTDGGYSNNTASVHQAEEQLKQQIINPFGKQLPSASLSPLSNGQNGIHQGILAHQLPDTQAGQSVGLQPTDGCRTNSTTSFSSNASQQLHNYSVKVSHYAF